MDHLYLVDVNNSSCDKIKAPTDHISQIQYLGKNRFAYLEKEQNLIIFSVGEHERQEFRSKQEIHSFKFAQNQEKVALLAKDKKTMLIYDQRQTDRTLSEKTLEQGLVAELDWIEEKLMASDIQGNSLLFDENLNLVNLKLQESEGRFVEQLQLENNWFLHVYWRDSNSFLFDWSFNLS